MYKNSLIITNLICYTLYWLWCHLCEQTSQTQENDEQLKLSRKYYVLVLLRIPTYFANCTCHGILILSISKHIYWN